MRFLTQRAGLSVGSSVGQELEGTQMPAGYLKGMGSAPYRRFRTLWERLPQRVEARRSRRVRGSMRTHSNPPARGEYPRLRGVG